MGIFWFGNRNKCYEKHRMKSEQTDYANRTVFSCLLWSGQINLGLYKLEVYRNFLTVTNLCIQSFRFPSIQTSYKTVCWKKIPSFFISSFLSKQKYKKYSLEEYSKFKLLQKKKFVNSFSRWEKVKGNDNFYIYICNNFQIVIIINNYSKSDEKVKNRKMRLFFQYGKI